MKKHDKTHDKSNDKPNDKAHDKKRPNKANDDDADVVDTAPAVDAELPAMRAFADLNIAPALLKEIAAKGFTLCTAVQSDVLNADSTHDLVVSSQTGSGKTLAFGLAFAPTLFGDAERVTPQKKPRTLVVAPTRELALQVARELTWLFASSGARVGTCVGGMDIRREERMLFSGLDIVVATPGRACDHIEHGVLKLDGLRTVVLDEADEMLDMGFRDELEKILDATPATRRTLLFSATFPRAIEALTKKYTKDPDRIVATATSGAHKDIEYVVHAIAPRERDHTVVNVLRYHDASSALVFCATRAAVTDLCGRLVERGFSAVALSGELSQAERNRALLAVREDRAKVLVATDVAARGIDLPNVTLVVHADLPQDAAVLQHRSGRTGRAGKKGTAVVLVPFARKKAVEQGLRRVKINAAFTPIPTAADIQKLDDERLVAALNERVKHADPVDVVDASDTLPRKLAAQFSAEQLAEALVHELRKNRPAPEQLGQFDDRNKARDRGRDGGRDRFATDRAPDRHAVDGGNDRRGPRDDRPRPNVFDDDAPPRRPRGDSGGVWFVVNVGREQRADPKWLLPMLCRRGKITKSDLGTFEIRSHETRFEINPNAAAAFERSASRPDKQDPGIVIDRAQ